MWVHVSERASAFLILLSFFFFLGDWITIRRTELCSAAVEVLILSLSCSCSGNDSRVVLLSSLSIVETVVCWVDGNVMGWGGLSLKGQQIITGFSLLLV